MRRAGVLSLVVALSLSAAARADGPQPLQVRIENATGETIRCVAVLAHFVTRALAPVPGGGSHEITLLREPASGSLSYGSHDGHPLLLENLLCGTTRDWTASARDLPLLPLRTGPAIRFDYRCGLARGGVACGLR